MQKKNLIMDIKSHNQDLKERINNNNQKNRIIMKNVID